MNKLYSGVYNTVIGQLVISGSADAVTEVRMLGEDEAIIHSPSIVTDLAAQQIREYLSGERRVFTVPVKTVGTEFQMRVWSAIAEIPYGETVTYSELAGSAGSPASVRAAANACGKNPVMIIVPCHRIVGKQSIGGFAYGAALKKILLDIEASK